MAKSPECLFVWTKTNSLMGEDKWPFYGSLAVATYAKVAGAGVQIIDRRQQTKQEDFEDQVKNSDIVFVGTVTSDIPDTKEVIKAAQKYGKPVVVGGVHPTAITNPKEAFSEASTVMLGDGTSVIGQVIKDWQTDNLRSIYQGDRTSEGLVSRLDQIQPDRNLMPNKGSDHLNSLVTEIGCPNTCVFCFDANTGTHRRDPKMVVEEIGNMGEEPFFANFDDNIIGADPAGAKTLAKTIIENGLKPKWFGNTDITCLLYPDVLSELREAGMASIYIGFESIFDDTLRFAGKLNLIRRVFASGKFGNPPETITSEHIQYLYTSATDMLHKMGFTVYCGLICGWPNETSDRIEQIVDFAERVPDMPWLSIATPYPGTALERYMTKNNIPTLPYESGAYDTNHFVFEHPKEDESHYYRAIKEFYLRMGSEAVVQRKLNRLQGHNFENWAVESVKDNLLSLRQKATVLYKQY